MLRVIPSTGAALAGSALIGAGLPCALIVALTAVQRETPQELVGRVAATAYTFVFAPSVVAQAVGAGAIAVVDHRALLVAVGAGGVASVLWCLRGLPEGPAAPGSPAAPGAGAGTGAGTGDDAPAPVES
jgi:hypothetical protein